MGLFWAVVSLSFGCNSLQRPRLINNAGVNKNYVFQIKMLILKPFFEFNTK